MLIENIMPGGWDAILASYLSLEEVEVEAGFTEGHHSRTGSHIPTLAAVLEYGSVKAGIPERPFMHDSAILSRNDVAKASRKAVANYVFKKKGLAALQPIADVQKDHIKQAMQSGKFKSLSHVTVDNRKERGSTSTTPLDETGELIDHIKTDIKRK